MLNLVKMYFTAKNLLSQEEGQDLVEYALLAALLSLAAIAVIPTLGNTINTIFSSINSDI